MSVRVFPAAGEADEVRSLDLYNAIHPREPATLAEARDWRRQQRHSGLFLAERDGELAGSAHIGIPTYSDRPTGKAYVLSTHRRHGVGRALYGALSSWAAAHAAEAMQTFIDDDDPESLAWAERRGFREVSREALVELRLATYEPRPVEPPEGLEIVTWAERPELARGLYDVAAEVGPDIPGDEDHRIEPFEEWLSVHMQGVADRPESTFAAVADGEVVGYAKLTFWDAKPDTLFHELTGVKRTWRGRGIARALKHAQLNWAKEQGYTALRTSNEERNEPIRRLNAELGYEPIPGRIKLEGPIAG
jgi:GNAT superfamily N-acetyltransferase